MGQFLILLLLTLAAGCIGAQTTIQRPAYTAVIDTTGELSSLKVGGTELLARPLELCPGVKWTLKTLTPVATPEIENPQSKIENIQALLTSDRGQGQIDYRFDDKQVRIELTQKIGGYQSWQAVFGPEVLGVENLQDRAVDAPEEIDYVEHGEIRALPLVLLPRTQRVRLYLSNGARVLFWHEGRGAPFNLDGIGGLYDTTYIRNLLESNQPMRVVFELEAPPAQPLRPAPAYVPFGDSFGNIFTAGASIRFTLKFTDATRERLKTALQWRLGWTVRDFYNRAVASGSEIVNGRAAFDTKQASLRFAPPARGWFSLFLTLEPATRQAPPVLPSEYLTRFAVVDRNPAFPDLPAPTEHLSGYGYAGLMGLKGMRESHTMREFFPAKGQTNWKALDQLFDTTSQDARRWGVHWFFQANERPAWCTDQDYEQIAYEMVSRYKDRCQDWEVENEPNFRMSPEDYVARTLIPFATGARRADPACHILAPACVAVPISLRYLQVMVSTGAIKLVDGISTHTYVGPGEPWELFGNPQYLAKLRELAGDRPLWQTEQGYTWNVTSRQQQARYVVRQYLNSYAAGIANEHEYYFYTVHSGFEPWYLVEDSGRADGLSGTLEPAGVALRILNEQTAGRTVGALEQPLFGVYMLRFLGPQQDVVALWTLDFPLTLTLRGKITQATDFMGNPIPLKPTGADTLVPADGCAIYLQVPHGEKLTVVSPRLGVDYAAAAQGATAHASSATPDHPAAHAIDGRWAMRDAVPGLDTRTYWEAATQGASETSPVWLQVDFPAVRTLDRSLLLCPLPAVDGGVPRDFAVQVSDDGSQWQTIASVAGWVGWVHLLSFKPVKARHARLLITKLNDGWYGDGKWMFMGNHNFTRFTSMRCHILDWKLFGP